MVALDGQRSASTSNGSVRCAVTAVLLCVSPASKHKKPTTASGTRIIFGAARPDACGGPDEVLQPGTIIYLEKHTILFTLPCSSQTRTFSTTIRPTIYHGPCSYEHAGQCPCGRPERRHRMVSAPIMEVGPNPHVMIGTTFCANTRSFPKSLPRQLP